MCTDLVKQREIIFWRRESEEDRKEQASETGWWRTFSFTATHDLGVLAQAFAAHMLPEMVRLACECSVGGGGGTL